MSGLYYCFCYFLRMQRKEDQWEGFQQFCQSNSSRDQEGKEQTKTQQQPTRAISADPSKQISMPKQQLEQKPKTSPYKKNKVKVKIYELSPKKQEESEKLVTHEIVKIQNNNDNESPPKQSVRHSKYQRIPIMRKDDDFRYAVLLLDHPIPIFGRQRKSISLRPFHNTNLKPISSILLIVGSKVGIQDVSFKVGEAEYDLYMRVDTNTNGHRQWFYFSVRNLVPGVIKFNIYRFKKKFSLFQRGMRPYVFSMKSKSGWKPGCMKVMYKTQRFVSDHHKNPNESPTYYLSFQYKFEFPEDEVYFASGIPYPVSYLNKRLAEFQSAPNNQIQLEISNIGKTLCGQDVKFIQISPKIKSGLNYIIINARTHAGETSSSWVLDGLLQRLLTDDSIKKWINDNNICFKIIPMLNPDGVFVGNYRTGILGEDFNRKFATGKKELFPQIHILRKVINDCKRSGKVLLFFDLHGHSVLKNSFIYGPSQSLFSQHPFRNLPFTIWHQSKYFRLSSCKFKFNQDMAETARIYFQIKQNILTYTCQISLGLYYQGNNTIQMLEEDYKSLGQSMIVSMVQLLTKQKVNNFQTTQETAATLQKIIQASNEVNEQPKNTVKQPTLPKQIVDKGQNKSINKREKQKDRETCLQKIKNIKKQLQEEQNFVKRQYTSLEQDKIQKSMNKSSLNKRKLQLNCSIEGATDKLSVRPANKLSFAPRKISAFDPFDLNQTQQEGSPVKATRIQQKKAHREAQFKIRRKSDMNRILPESLRKKLGPKIQLGFTSTKHFKQQEEQQSYMLERSATYDTPYLSTQIQKITENTQQQNGENLEIINEKFSEEYQSINDSDGSSEDLCEKQKQYLIECIKNNKKLKTTENDDENQQQQEQEVEETGNSTAVNINGFKQIRFKSIETEAIKTMFPLRSTKRDAHKFRDLTHKSLGRNLYDQQGMMMPQMIQKKQLNERINKKNVREPYFLVQIKNKNH